MMTIEGGQKRCLLNRGDQIKKKKKRKTLKILKLEIKLPKSPGSETPIEYVQIAI